MRARSASTRVPLTPVAYSSSLSMLFTLVSKSGLWRPPGRKVDLFMDVVHLIIERLPVFFEARLQRVQEAMIPELVSRSTETRCFYGNISIDIGVHPFAVLRSFVVARSWLLHRALSSPPYFL